MFIARTRASDGAMNRTRARDGLWIGLQICISLDKARGTIARVKVQYKLCRSEILTPIALNHLCYRLSTP